MFMWHIDSISLEYIATCGFSGTCSCTFNSEKPGCVWSWFYLLVNMFSLSCFGGSSSKNRMIAIVVLICMAVITRNIEHLSIYTMVISLSSFEKCLFLIDHFFLLFPHYVFLVLWLKVRRVKMCGFVSVFPVCCVVYKWVCVGWHHTVFHYSVVV